MTGKCAEGFAGDEDKRWRQKAVGRGEWVSVIKEAIALRRP
jgi:hypothetical protein